MAYLLDANIFIQAKNLHYGFDFCPAFWDWMDSQNAKGAVYSIEKVRDELIAGADELSAWAQGRKSGFFLPPRASSTASLASVSSWAGGRGYEAAAISAFFSSADYYLVAQAHDLGYIVVTHEKASNSTKKIKIPDACMAVGIQITSPYEMLRLENARFILGS